MRVHQTTVRFDDEDWRRLKQKAEEEGFGSAAAWIRHVVIRWLGGDDEPSGLDLAERVARIERQIGL